MNLRLGKKVEARTADLQTVDLVRRKVVVGHSAGYDVIECGSRNRPVASAADVVAEMVKLIKHMVRNSVACVSQGFGWRLRCGAHVPLRVLR